MKSWVKFIFIFSIALNAFLIADFMFIAFNKGVYHKNLDASVGVWGLSKKGAGKLLHHAISKEPELADRLMQVRESRKKIKEQLLEEPFDRDEVEQTFTSMRNQSIMTQQRIHTIFLDYVEFLPTSERQEMIRLYIYDHGRGHEKRDEYEDNDDDDDEYSNSRKRRNNPRRSRN